MRYIDTMLRSLLISSTFIMSGWMLAPDAMAQSSEQTQRTDKSEEDWRKSQRKAGSEDRDDPFSQTQSTGIGGVLPPLRPIDSLPEESRRHLSKERAKAIAGMEGDGRIQKTSYEPSERAKSDPGLAAEEEAVWKEMIEDLQGSGGNQDDGSRSGDQPSGQGEQNDPSDQNSQSRDGGQTADARDGQQVGGAGQPSSNQSSASQGQSVMRGGSAASASDILKQIRNGTAGTQSTAHKSGSAQSSDGSPSNDASAPAEQTSGQSGQPGSSDDLPESVNSDQSGASAEGTQRDNGVSTSEQSSTGEASETDGASADGEAGAPGEQSTAVADAEAQANAPKAAPIGSGASVGESGSSSSASDYIKEQHKVSDRGQDK